MSGARGSWERPLREHRAAVDRFLETTARVPAERWSLPLAEGKWSPAQVAEHVALFYEQALSELGGGEPMRRRVGRAMETVLRWVVLPHILFHRTIPVAVHAPRQLRPSEAGAPREGFEARLRAAVERFERELARDGTHRVTHPYFGRLALPRAMRFAAVHTEHHARQMDPVAAPRG